MESPESGSRYKKRAFPGESSSSAWFEEVEILETAPSGRKFSRPSSSKKKEGITTDFPVPCSTSSNEGSKNVDLDDPNSNVVLGEDGWIEKYYEDITFDDTFLESQFDIMDMPHEVEVPFPSLPGSPQVSMNSTPSPSSSFKIEANGTHHVSYPYTSPSQLTFPEKKKKSIRTDLDEGCWANKYMAKDAVSSTLLERTAKIIGGPQIRTNSTHPTSSSLKIDTNRTHHVPYPYNSPSPQLKFPETKKQMLSPDLKNGSVANRHMVKDAVGSMLGGPQISTNSITPTSSSFKNEANWSHHVPNPYIYPIPQPELHEIKKPSILPDFKEGGWANRRKAKDAAGSILLGTGGWEKSSMALSNTAAYLNSGNGSFLALANDKNNSLGPNGSYPSQGLKSGLTRSNFWNTKPNVGSSLSPALGSKITKPSVGSSFPPPLGSKYFGSMGGSDVRPWGEITVDQNEKPPVQRNLDEILREFEVFKKFDTVEDCSDHRYGQKNSNQVNPPKNWAKRIQEEWKILENDLPEAIFVRVYESRMDLLRAVIVGAEGTPYHDGLFVFDVLFPCSYPNSPPQVFYHSGGLRLNPNLYNCGKVCLSLLNTWRSNSQKERWIPGVSTMLQVLVSIQGLILNAQPYFNEPGYDITSGTTRGEEMSLQYNEDTFIYNLQTMVYTMRRPPKHFEALVAGHFCKHARDILVSCKAYLDGAQVGCLVRGGIQDVDEGDKSCSENFKYRLAEFITTLIGAFSRTGATNCDEFLSLAEKAKNGPPPPVGQPRSLVASYNRNLQKQTLTQHQYPYM